MRRVIFPLVFKSNSNLIKYPDEEFMFSSCQIVGNDMIADYIGNKTESQIHSYNIQKVKITIQSITSKNPEDGEFILYKPENKMLYAQMDTPFIVSGTIENYPTN